MPESSSSTSTTPQVRLSKLSRSIAGRVAIVTGAGSGMGRATAFLFADEGAHVALIDRNTEGLLETRDAIVAAGGTTRAYECDVASDASVSDVVSSVRRDLGPIDILVNNAGISMFSPIASEDFFTAWNATIAVNLTAHTLFVRACLDDLRRNNDGRVVNIASTEGLGATPGISAYTAAKHGVIGLTRSLAVELGPLGITVNCICPGPIHTGMTEMISDEAKTTFAHRRTALRRYGDPEEVAHATLSLVLPAASFISGAALVVDGGLTIRNA
jgi:3-oxoacyl-[acyl-carrier protein] reductase